MGRMYVSPLALSVTNDADQDVWRLNAGATVPLILHEFYLSSEVTTDERVNLRLVRRTTDGTGGSAESENELDGGNTVAASAAMTSLVTAPGTAGDVLHNFRWSQLVPLNWLPTPEGRILVPAATRIALHLQTAVASTRAWQGYVVWEEF
jgi:hypothetical protein